MFADFFTFYHKFRSPQVKAKQIITTKRSITNCLRSYQKTKLRNFKEMPEMLGFYGEVFSRPPKREILTVVLKNFKKTDVNIPQKNLLYFISQICLQYFAQSCRKDPRTQGNKEDRITEDTKRNRGPQKGPYH